MHFTKTGSPLPQDCNAENDFLREGETEEKPWKERRGAAGDVSGQGEEGPMDSLRTGQRCSAQAHRKGVGDDVRLPDCYGERTGFAGWRAYSGATITWSFHLTLLFSFIVLHYK